LITLAVALTNPIIRRIGAWASPGFAWEVLEPCPARGPPGQNILTFKNTGVRPSRRVYLVSLLLSSSEGERNLRIKTNRQLVSLLAILLAAAVVGGVVLMEQIQPAVPVGSNLTQKCARTAPTPNNVTLGSSGSMTFSCSSSAPATNPAFTNTATVISTPTVTGFVAPYNVTRLYIYTAGGSPNTGFCFSRAGNLRVVDGSKLTIPAGQWNYCAEYENVGTAGLPEFKVSWSI